MEAMLDLLAIGDIKLDTFVIIPEASISCALNREECQVCIAYGHKIPTSQFVDQIAGSAPNVAVGANRLGLRSGVFSVMGQDDIATKATEFLKSEGVSTDLIIKQEGFESSRSVVLNFKGESTQLVSHFEFHFIWPKKKIATKAIHLSELGDGYDDFFIDLGRFKKESGVFLSFNPGAIQIKEQTPAFIGLLGQTDLLFLNVAETRALLGDNRSDASELASKVGQLTKGAVIVTNGAMGAYLFKDGQTIFSPPAQGVMVEATGAGDAFACGVNSALLLKHNWKTALSWGAKNAASVIGKVGPTAGLLYREQIDI